MPIKNIHDIENMQPEAVELFEAAGFTEIKTISDTSIEDIVGELKKANNVLEIIDTDPSRAMVIQWLKPLENELGDKLRENRAQIATTAVIEEKDLLNTQFAIPLSNNFIREHELDLNKMPNGSVLFIDQEKAQEYYQDEEIIPVNYNLVNNTSANEAKTSDPAEVTNELHTSTTTSSEVLDKNRIMKMEDFQKEGSQVVAIKKEKTDEINLTKTTRKETNEGVNPNSRFYIKGVLHKNISRFKTGCYSFLFVNILLIISFFTFSLVLIDRERYWWAVWAPLLALLALFIYFTAAQKASCPICNQKQFAPKRCLKHRNAHRWPIVGYMLPTALHAIVFKWFRCIFCGTSVRLKE